MIYVKLLLTTFLSAALCSCAETYAYDPGNPDAYRKHWENNPEIKENSFLYSLSEECRDGKKQQDVCFTPEIFK